MSTRHQHITKALLAAVAIAASGSVLGTCWDEASKEYQIPIGVLKGIAKTESNFNASAKNLNINGSEDIGLMQINSIWLPELAKFSIDKFQLQSDACLNLKVGAWILSQNVRALGWNWNAIGAYNVGCAKLSVEECKRRRDLYAAKVHSAMAKVAVLDPEIAPGSKLQAHSDSTRKLVVVSLDRVEPRVLMSTPGYDDEGDEGEGFFDMEPK